MSTKSHSSGSGGGGGGKGKDKSTSNNNNLQKLKNNSDVIEDKKELIKTRELVSQISHSCFSDPDSSFNNTNSEKVENGRVHRRRRSACSLRIGIGEVVPVPVPVAVGGGSNFHGNDCLMEIENPSEGKTTGRGKTKLMIKTSLKEVSNWLTTSKELIRVLNHVWAAAAEDQHRPSSTSSLITALKSELDRAKTRVDHLIKDQSLFHHHGDEEIEVLMKRFADEKAAWKYRERARVRSAVSSMADEVEIQKKLRKQAERLNKTIAKELAHAKLSLSKAINDLQREKRAKEIFEQICEELAKGIGEDRAEFEELKKESAKVREEVEKEREMLQLADVLREERVQMKLSEAKYHFEEKNAAVERLKEELEAYLISGQMGNENRGIEEDKFEKIKELEAYLKKINFGSCQEEETKEDECSEEEEESDLQSIELNMDNNNKSYRWSFVQNRNSFEKDHILQSCCNGGRNSSASDKIQWGSICLNTKPNGEFVENSERFDWERFTEIFAQSKSTHGNENENEKKNEKKIKSGKCLRDILFPETRTEDQIMEDEASSVVINQGMKGV